MRIPSKRSTDHRMKNVTTKLRNKATSQILNSSAYTYSYSTLPGINVSRVNESNLEPKELSNVESSNHVESLNAESNAESNVINVYSEDGGILNLPKRKLSRHQLTERGKISPSKLKGNRCTAFKVNSMARSKSRMNHRKGIAKKMRDVKITTRDEVYVAFHKDYGTQNHQIVRYATCTELFKASLPSSTTTSSSLTSRQAAAASSSRRSGSFFPQ